MTKVKNKYSVSKAVLKNEEGKIISTIYLSNRDEEQGKDIQLDLQGYEIIVL